MNNTQKSIFEKWKAAYPAIYLLSTEEPLVMSDIIALAKEKKRNCFTWTLGDGIVQVVEEGKDPKDGTGNFIKGTDGPTDVLSYMVEDIPKQSIVVLKDFHHFLDDPLVQAKFKKLLQPYKMDQRMVVVLTPILKIPEELKKDIALVETALPEPPELDTVLTGITLGTNMSGDDIPSGGLRKSLIDAARGLTTTEAENAFSLSLARSVINKTGNRWDPVVVLDEKCMALKKDGLLEYYPPGNEGLKAIGGMDVLKEWVTRRKDAFTDEAREFGCEAPAGVLLVGIPGTGKSLGAKATAEALGLPLLRCDMGKIFGSLVGESEANVRKVILTAEAVSPCVLWLDEIEKGFAGSSGAGAGLDSGVGSRVLGTFLTWMQEKKKAVFVYATANDVSMLPPELLRKGRFDEIFSVSLPTLKERQEIFQIHLAKRKRAHLIGDKDGKINIEELASGTEGWSGAEIEAVIKEGLFSAFAAKRELSQLDIQMAMEVTVPLSKTMKNKVQAMIEWCSGRTRPASTKEEPPPIIGRNVQYQS